MGWDLVFIEIPSRLSIVALGTVLLACLPVLHLKDYIQGELGNLLSFILI